MLGFISLFAYQLPWQLALIFTLPAVLDGLTQLLNWRQSNNPLRLVTGVLLGIGELTLVWIVANWIMQFGYTTGLQLMQ